jgi:N-acylethanolamine-hydrolysing acid amidase
MAVALGVSSNGLLMAQYINEFSAFCTSVIAYQADGTIFHGRNMDFFFDSTMRNMTFQGEFYKNGSLLYTAVMFAGINGVPTGWRDEFSISINNRKPSNRSSAPDLLQNIGLIFMGYTQNMKLIRNTLQECSTYDCAFEKLTNTPQIAPSYFAIAGSKNRQGAVITKDRMGPVNIDLLSPDNWYIAQTNDDHWTGVCTIRCQYVRDSMDAIGRDKITPE